MEKANIRMFTVEGSNEEIGRQLGERIQHVPELVNLQKIKDDLFTKQQVQEMREVFDQYCPGLTEELASFAKTIKVECDQLVYYAMTYLTPGCSIVALLPKITKNNHVLMARNYEYSHRFEDFSFCKTKVRGRYAHMGGSVALFGRSEGINEVGLAVAQTSCGIPVGNTPPLRQPALPGLQFWAVIRSLLENCATVEEAIHALQDMPIAYNINLILADKAGHVALFETLDGVKALKQIDEMSQQQYLHSTNHAHLQEIIPFEPVVMKHSLCRYERIDHFMKQSHELTTKDLKNLLLTPYPEGLACNWYDEFFGTIKSMVFDVTLGTVELCWGGLETNGWRTYSIAHELEAEELTVDIQPGTTPFDGTFVNL